jgi:hypothetical protein
VAVDADGEGVGMLAGIDLTDRIEVLQVWVAPDHRGKGLVERLFDEVLSWSPHERIDIAIAPGNERAMAAYVRLGFAVVGERPGRERVEVEMRRARSRTLPVVMATEPGSHFVRVVRFAFRSSKRIAVTVIGGVLVLGGIAMLVLPGPGILVVVAGFAVLGTEYAWAARALDHTKSAAESAGKAAKGAAGRAGRAARGAAGSATGRLRRPTRTDRF